MSEIEDLKHELDGLKGRVARMESALGPVLTALGIDPAAINAVEELTNRITQAENATLPSGMVSSPYQAGA